MYDTPMVILTNMAGFGHLTPAITLHLRLKECGIRSRIFFLESLLWQWRYRMLFESYEHSSKKNWRMANVVSYLNQYTLPLLRRTANHAYDLSSIKKFVGDTPPAIISFVGWGSSIASMLATSYKDAVPLFAIHTNWHVCDHWQTCIVDPAVPTYHLGCFESDGITQIGIPTAQLKKCILTEPEVLVSGGGWGLGNLKKIYMDIQSYGIRAHLAIGNKSKEHFSEFNRVNCTDATNEQIIGHIENHQETNICLYPAMHLASNKSEEIFSNKHPAEVLLSHITHFVGKPGGVSTYEALKKGIPVYLLPPTNITEAKNRTVLLQLGLAQDYTGPESLLKNSPGLIRSDMFLEDETSVFIAYISEKLGYPRTILS